MTGERATAMAARLFRTAVRNELPDHEAHSIARCFLYIMSRRDEVLTDHHPDYLHPARTALILMDDLGETDPATLRAAVLHDSARPDLSASVDEVVRLAGSASAHVTAELPPEGLDPAELTEAMVTSSPAALRVALADRLDHARHLHFRPPDDWAAGHRMVTEVYIPLAVRIHPLLTLRFERWAGAFERRFLRPTVN